MMRRYDVLLVCQSSSEHLTQLYTGFGMLHLAGLVDLRIRRDASAFVAGVSAPSILTAWVEGRRVVYDLADGPSYFEQSLQSCDFYFKRSYDPGRAEADQHGKKVRPLGLNYPVYGRGDFALRRALWSLMSAPNHDVLAQVVRSSRVLSSLFRANGGRTTSRVTCFESPPNPEARGILFLARAWPTGHIADPAKRQEREAINETRAACIRQLRKEFGPLFTGGLQRDRFAAENYPDCLVDDARLTRKGRYLCAMKGAGICVATAGLKGSNGWKLAEYVAASRAIVSERLCYVVPGGFASGEHYLEFAAPEQCVEAVGILVANADARAAMMRRNREYYESYLRPDRLVWNSLQEVLAPRPPAAP